MQSPNTLVAPSSFQLPSSLQFIFHLFHFGVEQNILKMRILPTLLLQLSRASNTCDTELLPLPKNGKGWLCDDENNKQVSNKRKCVLECQDNYTVENSELKILNFENI